MAGWRHNLFLLASPIYTVNSLKTSTLKGVYYYRCVPRSELAIGFFIFKIPAIINMLFENKKVLLIYCYSYPSHDSLSRCIVVQLTLMGFILCNYMHTCCRTKINFMETSYPLIS